MRQAFLKTIPRQEIVDRLIVPLNPDAELRDSFTTVPGCADATTPSSPRTARPSTPRSTSRAPGAARGGRRHDADRRALPLRRQQPAAGQRVRADPRLGGAGRLQRHRRQQPDVGPRTARTPSLYDASLFGWQSTAVDVAGTEVQLRHRRAEQPARLLERRASTACTTSCKAHARDADEQQELLLRDRAAAVGRRVRRHHLPAPGGHGVQQHVRVQRLGDPAVADDVLELLGVGSRLIG